MGLTGGTISLVQYMVGGEFPAGDATEWLRKRLLRGRFTPIDDVAAEKAAGWVALEDLQNHAFDDARLFLRHPYVCLAYRRDTRKVPKAIFNARVEQACREWLKQNRQARRIPKDRRNEIRELVHRDLLTKTLPAPALTDFVWNTATGALMVGALAVTELDAIEKLFKHCFEALSLDMIHPFARAQRLVEPKRRAALAQLNKARTDHLLDQIQDNLWLGQEFLLWLLHRSIEGQTDYAIRSVGPAEAGEPFRAHIDSRLVVVGPGAEGGVQKIVFTGPQSRFRELGAALSEGKALTEATLFFERAEEVWRLTLKGDTFAVGSFKTPKVRLDIEESADEADEREAYFYEKMALVEVGLQMLDSLLGEFLEARLSRDWAETSQELKGWARRLAKV
ncbi:MAG: exonuclease [Myxococcales bacterium]|nr:MAG: exonuclease [Myxococcales bacterium]